MTDEQVEALDGDYLNSPHFNEKEKCALRWTELVTRNEAKNDKKCWEELKKHFEPAEIVELTMICCVFNLLNRFNDSMLLDLDEPPPGMRPLKVGREEMARYAERILACVP